MTCNIRTSLADDGPDDWALRKDLCMDVIRSYDPDVLGFQEVSRIQYEDLQEGFPEFAAFGMADRADGINPTNAIFYRREDFLLRSQGGSWLSETPHVPGSSSWDAAYPRLANWVQLETVKGGHEFRYINTHLDHLSAEARDNQARMINEDAGAFPTDYPQILTGDMNCDKTTTPIQSFMKAGWEDTYAAINGNEDPGNTFHRFKGPRFQEEEDVWQGKIDFLLIRGGLSIMRSAIVMDQADGRYPSDHYFVYADLQIT